MCKVKYILFIYLIVNITQIIVSQNVKRCNCYMLGTFHNKEGQSICNKYTGVCSCLKNIDGIDCDKCREGYYNILSGRGCEFCACNMLGSVLQQCHQTTGKCQCKPGYTGDKCEFCVNEAPIISNKCCNCNEALSETSVCDRKGKCKCKAHAAGDKCERCKDNYYYKENDGCVTCGKCYETIGVRLKEYRTELVAAKKLIGETVVQNNNPNIWGQFKREIIKMGASFEKLLTEILDFFQNKQNNELSNNLIGNINDLMKKVKFISNKFNALIKKAMIKRNENLAKLQHEIENLNNTITLHYQNLNQAQPDIQNPKLTKIESESKSLYEKIGEVMKEIEIINGTTINVTKIHELYNSIKNAKNPHQAVLDELKENITRINRDWESDVNEITTLTVELKNNAEYIASRAQALKNLKYENIDIDESDFNDIKSKLNDYKFDLNQHIDVNKANNKVNKLNQLIEYIVQIREKNKKHIEEFNETKMIDNIIKISDKMKNERKMLEEKLELMKAELNRTNADIKETQNRLNEELLPQIKSLKAVITKFTSTNKNLTIDVNILINSLVQLNIEINDLIKTQKNKQEAVQMLSNDLNVFEAEINSLIKREETNKKLIKEFQGNPKEIEMIYMENITKLEELISILAINPLYEANHDELLEAEKEIEALEEYYRFYDSTVQYRNELKHEVEKMKVIVDNLPENGAFCRSSTLSKK